jgi:hypothetical protein
MDRCIINISSLIKDRIFCWILLTDSIVSPLPGQNLLHLRKHQIDKLQCFNCVFLGSFTDEEVNIDTAIDRLDHVKEALINHLPHITKQAPVELLELGMCGILVNGIAEEWFNYMQAKSSHKHSLQVW